jgi:hypothetical protein
MKLVLILFALAFSLAAQTRIVDNVGANASCQLAWPGFTVADGKVISAGSLPVTSTSGAISLLLHPNSQALPVGHFYRWRCRINGVWQAVEFWSVPASGSNLTIAAVRVATGSPPSLGGGGGGTMTFVDAETPSGTINGSNATFTLGNSPNPAGSLRVAINGVVQSAGDFSVAAQTLTLTSPPPAGTVLRAWYRYGGSGTTATFVDDETPSGTINGTNATFTLANGPNPAASLQVNLNGQVQTLTADYTLTGSTITMLRIPQTGASLKASYRR